MSGDLWRAVVESTGQLRWRNSHGRMSFGRVCVNSCGVYAALQQGVHVIRWDSAAQVD